MRPRQPALLARPDRPDQPALLAVIGLVIAAAIVLDLRNRPTAVGIDFHTYLAAAIVGVRDGWSQIYDEKLVAVAQHQLVPALWAQPYLSPPIVSWIAAPLSVLPYPLALTAWAAITLGSLLTAFAYSTTYRSWTRVLIVTAAFVPWWVLHSVQVGQVVPIVAAGLIVSWRLLRDKRDVLAGVALAVILLKPNTALWAPVVLLAAGRVRAFGSWVAVAAVVGIVSVVTLGPGGVQAYLHDLSRLPNGANDLTLNGTFGLTGGVAMAVRVVVIAAALATGFRLRASPGVAVALGALASLITSPYLHGSDLCVFLAAGWIVWHERDAPAWRALLTATWLFATPFVFDTKLGALLHRWALAEIALFVAIVLTAWLGAAVSARARSALTGSDDLARRAPA